MRLAASIRVWGVCGLCLGFVALSPAVIAERIAQCAKPPGEQVACEDDQLASCSVAKDMSVRGRCKSQPKKNMTPEEIKAWALSEILEKKVESKDLANREYMKILGEHKAQVNGAIVIFNIPTSSSRSRFPEW
jgi:hypothetical protein